MNATVCKGKSVRLTHRLALLTLFLCVFSGAKAQVTITTDPANPAIYLIQSYCNEAFYMRDNNRNNNPSKVNTSNIVTDNSEWYFLDGGTFDDVQYYYIVHKKTGKYVYLSSDAQNSVPQLKDAPTAGDEDHYRFKFVANVDRPGSYNIIVKLNSSTQSLNKNKGNSQLDNIRQYNINNDNSCWNLVAKEDYHKTTCPFQLSTLDGEKFYYKVQNNRESSLYMIPGSTYVVSSSTFDEENDRAWYFVKADEDEYLDYYYIVHPKTGKYLHYRGDATHDSYSDAVELSNITSDLGSFLYIIVPGSRDNETHASTTSSFTYCIAPKKPMVYRVENTVSLCTKSDTQGTNDGQTLRAFKERNGNDHTHWNFIPTDYNITCPSPVIEYNAATNTVSISAATGAIIYYTTDGSDPTVPASGNTQTTSSNLFSFTPDNNVSVIRAVAARQSTGSDVSDQAYQFIRYNTVSSSDEITNLNIGYRLAENFNSSATIGDANHPFRGAIDGDYHSFSLGHALIGVADNALIKNVVVSSATVSGSGDDVGAIVNTAKGATKIYNCGVQGGTVTGGTNTGGLVGLIEAGSSVRVVNCYNFADVTGGGGTDTYAAGIVGKNEGTVADDKTVGNVRIALCMMYGNVTSATNTTNISPVYGGNHVNNIQNFTEYNYWRYRSGMVYSGGAYNDQMAIERDDFLTRFQFYTHILNTHREMAAFFLFGGVASTSASAINENQIEEIGHWVLKKDVASYPIIEPWQTNTKKVLEAPTPSNILTEMGTNGYLSVTVKIGAEGMSGSSPIQTTISLPITDMDEANYDYTWGKVVLPFANEFRTSSNEVWTPDYTKICTGWKITKVTKGNTDYTTFSVTNYNFADRDNPLKDIYDESNNNLYIFAQGGNYIVPYGVTAIEITANFAKAFYLRDATYDIAYSGDKNSEPFGYTGRTGLADSPTPSTYHEQPVYNTLLSALSASGMSASATPHTQAVVLVGNFHMDAENLSSKTSNGFTIMSIDADNNQEPDYAIYSNNSNNRPPIPPTRFDFVAFIPLGMSSHVTNAKFYPNTPIWKPRGWFEITETGLMFANQFEIQSNNFDTDGTNVSINYRCIINGGYFTQMVRSFDKACTRLSYYKIGGNAYIKEFYPGNHSDKTTANTLVPVNVTGGEIEQCFMTGYGKAGGKAYGPNIYFWCAGGKIHKFLGAYMEPPVQSSSHTSNNPGIVDLTAKIDHAIIGRFFGGGTTSKARVTGVINVTIDNSRVDFYCGGPEFGDMTEGKTVTTHAKNTTFGEYYGAGFGGTAITYKNDVDDGNVNLQGILNYPSEYFTDNYVNNGRLHYLADYGLGNCYKFEFIMHSRGHRGVARFYRGYASFSLATTGSVTNNLDHCTVLGNFFGAGCQGKVSGTVTSTLTDCTLLGSAFGGGYKASANEVDVYPTTMPALSEFKAETGIFSDFGTVEPEKFTWEQGDDDHYNVADDDQKILYTAKENVIKLADLGNVTGKITLSVEGHTIVKGSVFGGGFESKSLSDTEVKILGQTKVLGNIYGGGNMGEVEGNTKVIVNSNDGSSGGGGSGGGGGN